MSDVQVANCPNPDCNSPIPLSHPYPWCTECGERFPEEIQARLPRLHEGKAKAEAAVEELKKGPRYGEVGSVEILGRPLRCVICQHDLFVCEELDWSTVAAALFTGASVPGPERSRYICARCNYVHSFR